MYGPTEFAGGVFSKEITDGRASATIQVSASGLEAVTSTGQTFRIAFRDCQIEMGGASGRMVFCRTADRQLTIFCEDRQFPAALEMDAGTELAEQLQAVKSKRRAEGVRWRAWMAVALVVSLLALVGGYFGLLAAAKASIDIVPVAVDEKIGTMAINSMDPGGAVVQDPVIVEAVTAMVQRLEPHATLPGLTFEVRVIESSDINAFCLPGGKMVVYTGLLKKAETAEQVAGVISHEMAHAVMRHGLQRVAQSLGIVAAFELMIGDVGGLVALGVELAQSAALTSYSREHEVEADLVGVEMLHAAAIDPLELAAFFEMLQKDQGDLPAAVAWLSTHPEHRARIASIRGAVGELPPQKYRPLDIDWEAVQKQLE